MKSIEAFPLHWPAHRKRTAAQSRQRANFHRRVEKQWQGGGTYQAKESLSIADSRDRLFSELKALGASNVIISSNLELKLDGTPRSNQREPDDSGIAVYFQLNKQPHCLSCDAWNRCADNLAAIAKHVDAMRGQLRWGVADIASMFAGFKALPNAIITPTAMTLHEAAVFVRFHAGIKFGDPYGDPSVDWESFNHAYKRAARKLHPDQNEGRELPEWHTLQSAAQILRQHLSPEKQ